MAWLRGPRWKEQPPLGTRLDKSHPLGAALDSCWYRESLIDFERGVRAPVPATAGMNGSAHGVGWGRNSSAGTQIQMPEMRLSATPASGPLIAIAFARLQSAGTFISLANTGGGHNARISNASSSFNATVQGNFGTTQSLTLSGLGTLAGTHQLVVLQVFSPTDYRMYGAGQMVTGSVDCAAGGDIRLNNVAHPGANQNCALFAGFGRGRALPDDYLMALTRDPQRVWEAFQPRALWFPVTGTVSPSVYLDGGVLKYGNPGASRKLYLNNGGLVAKTAAGAGDKLVTLAAGSLSAQ